MTNLKNLLLENYSKYFDDLLSGERSLPFGLLVFTRIELKHIARPVESDLPICTVYVCPSVRKHKWTLVGYLYKDRCACWQVCFFLVCTFKIFVFHLLFLSGPGYFVFFCIYILVFVTIKIKFKPKT